MIGNRLIGLVGKASASGVADLGSFPTFFIEIFQGHVIFLSSYLINSRSLADLWGTTVDFTTSFLHSSRFSAFRSSIFHSVPVHSLDES